MIDIITFNSNRLKINILTLSSRIFIHRMTIVITNIIAIITTPIMYPKFPDSSVIAFH